MMKPIKILIICSIIAIICCLIYFLYQSSKELESNPKILRPMKPVKNFGDLRHLDVMKYPLPYTNFETNVRFKEYSLAVDDCEVNVIESRPNGHALSPSLGAGYSDPNGTAAFSSLKVDDEAVPSRRSPFQYHRLTFLFLHGQSFTSKTWFDLKTMHLVSHMGHRGIAVDLPGYGKTQCRRRPDATTTPSSTTGKSNLPASPLTAEEVRMRGLHRRSDFLEQLITSLAAAAAPSSAGDEGSTLAARTVLVSPSMSGTYAVPYVMFHARGADPESRDRDDGDEPEVLRAFVPIAPAGTEQFDFGDYKNVAVPTMVVYGERDTGLGLVSRRALEQIPTSVVAEIPNAGHACYLDRPEVWHRVLYNFIRAIE